MVVMAGIVTAGDAVSVVVAVVFAGVAFSVIKAGGFVIVVVFRISVLCCIRSLIKRLGPMWND